MKHIQNMKKFLEHKTSYLSIAPDFVFSIEYLSCSSKAHKSSSAIPLLLPRTSLFFILFVVLEARFSSKIRILVSYVSESKF